jgi:hypothetical protein
LLLLSASTVIVKKEVNYVDSQWENNGIMDFLIYYLYECANIKIDTVNELELLLSAGKKLIDGCKTTLNETNEVIKNTKVYAMEKI